MIVTKYVIQNPENFDIELANNIVNALSNFSSTVLIETDARTVDANSIINLMSLSPEQNQEIIIKIHGNDSHYTHLELEKLLLESGFVSVAK